MVMEAAVQIQLFSYGTRFFSTKKSSRNHTDAPSYVHQKSSFSTQCLSYSSYPIFPIVGKHRNATKIYARRRRSNTETDTYVLMEPGKAEEFVNEEELRVRLKGWLENWPGTALPPDLARYKSLDDAVTFLVKSVFVNLKLMEMLAQFSGMKLVWNENYSSNLQLQS